ncbi:hypothetical protein JHK86_014862 [Glycine max]|nr:hypothetical protein JHK86_014862 [Glycine max]
MAPSGSSNNAMASPRVLHFDLIEGMQLAQNYDIALRELPSHLPKGITLTKSRNSYLTGRIKPVNDNRDQLRSGMHYSYLRKYNIEDWLQKHSEGHAKGAISTAALIENFIGGTDVLSKQIYHVHNYEIMFNIATELTDRCKTEGELGLIGILVWMRFMACRHLTWNKNFNIVKGLGETLVGAYPGRATTFIMKKTNLKYPVVTSYPSKLMRLYSKKSIIFRSDSNAEDLEGFAGAGLFDR